jgi:itaconate CoA-transferase
MHPNRSSGVSGNTGPLAGLRVVAIEHSVAGPLASRILGELGAEVVKVERPESGDFSRHWDQNVHGEGAQFWWLNRFKRSAAIDLKSADGQQALTTLLAQADVLLHNLTPPSAKRLGLDEQNVRTRFPQLINCQISGYGADGPATERKAYDMLVQAEAGVMSHTGTEDQAMRVGVSISDVTTGIYSALLILAALVERRQTGIGRHLDVAMFDVTLEFLGPMLVSYLNAGTTYPRIPDHHHAIAPYGAFACQDGDSVLIAVEQDSEWRRLCLDVLDDQELAGDPRYRTNTLRLDHREDLKTILSDRFAKRTSDRVIEALRDAGLAYAKVNDVSFVADHDVVAHRRIIQDSVTHDGHQVRRLAGIAERLFGVDRPDRDRPPTLGEDTESVLAEVLSGLADRIAIEELEHG